MTDEPETFAAAMKSAKNMSVIYEGSDILDRLVAAHEREVGKLLMDNVRLTASLVCEDNPHIAKDLATANRMIERKDATIAELKEQLADAKRCADRYESELSNVATQCGHAKAQIAELKEALRRIAGSAQSCAGNINEQCDNNCRSCVNYAANIARAALEKTEGGKE